MATGETTPSRGKLSGGIPGTGGRDSIGGLGSSVQQPTCLCLRDGGCTEADSDGDEGSKPTEEEGEIEVVHVLQHDWPPICLPTSWGWVRELQDHAQKSHSQAKHEAPEGSLWREGRRRQGCDPGGTP